MSRTREAIIMGIGILAGIALSGSVAQAATATVTAEPSSQPIYVDGALVEMEAYGIHGNNFVKLAIPMPTSHRSRRPSSRSCWSPAPQSDQRLKQLGGVPADTERRPACFPVCGDLRPPCGLGGIRTPPAHKARHPGLSAGNQIDGRVHG